MKQRTVFHKSVPSFGFKNNYHTQGKTGAIVSTKPTFEWINQIQGLGKIKVAVIGQAFSNTTMSYQWVIPTGSSSRGFLSGEFEIPKVNENVIFELDVEGLNSKSSQNVILLLKSVSGNRLGTSVVIPTIFSQTLEAKISSQFSPKLSDSLQKSIVSHGAKFNGVQF